ncbi:chemotaxis protein CheW [Desulfovibrio sp. TomC]|uniref:chemotaxis protein CheW n=1 Tax=Desulfovibrio sp. TomC TaxID=1562888 RepID=UPI000573B618|nr:chemotaxis protein CheW [Desulfovibrio sp. TomC]KHK02755.1 Positive regulator of CheA protein activity (CheW) [Desulfovibrio sp. TomC]
MAQDAQYGSQRFLTLTLGDELFAIDIFSVREILDYTDITRIPQTPEYMRGVVNVRGSAVPVVDLRMKFGLGQVERTLNTRIVIVEIKKDDTLSVMGALADSVKEVLELETDRIDPPPRMGAAVRADFIRGIGKHGERFLLVLDVDKVFSSDEVQDLSRMMGDATQPPPEATPTGSDEDFFR